MHAVIFQLFQVIAGSTVAVLFYQFEKGADLIHVSRMSNAPQLKFNVPWNALVRTEGNV